MGDRVGVLGFGGSGDHRESEERERDSATPSSSKQTNNWFYEREICEEAQDYLLLRNS